MGGKWRNPMIYTGAVYNLCFCNELTKPKPWNITKPDLTDNTKPKPPLLENYEKVKKKNGGFFITAN